MSEPVPEEQEQIEEQEPETDEPGEGDEPEQGDEADEEDAPAAPPAPPPGPTPESLEKRARSAETRFATYARGVRSLYEDEAENLLDCPLCPTFHKGMIDARFAGHLPEDVVDAVKFYLGFAREQEYAADPGTSACSTCQGKGKTKTGSTVPGQETRTCQACRGYGYTPPPTTTQTSTNGVTNTSVDQIAEAVLQTSEDRDEWGEPRILPDGRENPNFGKMPNRKIPVEPYGVTANLSPMDAAAA